MENQEKDEIEIKVPNIKEIKKIIFEKLIKKKRIKTFINEVWTQ